MDDGGVWKTHRLCHGIATSDARAQGFRHGVTVSCRVQCTRASASRWFWILASVLRRTQRPLQQSEMILRRTSRKVNALSVIPPSRGYASGPDAMTWTCADGRTCNFDFEWFAINRLRPRARYLIEDLSPPLVGCMRLLATAMERGPHAPKHNTVTQGLCGRVT
ncbi:hypothetical protein K466DRAFT_357042 [Polyporus arcularius HHB13444]|uniref:Uncharacterized protein n=1 Tax=Polyporus arcularius HHB13444 TaxID=1314778 RepID=A0A5C3PNS6_9APHY|nr:hypothetical protein K466DRAFT_357042 [Polyporus arcularius HHB13444]